MKKILIIFGLLIIALLAVWVFVKKDIEKIQTEVVDFDTCVKAGFPVLESYPRQCVTENGERYVENTGSEASTDFIRVKNPLPNSVISSPLEITGEAKGIWFFEGSFGVSLFDSKGISIKEHYISAIGEWMTEDFVSFSGSLEFAEPATDTGTLILKQADPSGGANGVPAIVAAHASVATENCSARSLRRVLLAHGLGAERACSQFGAGFSLRPAPRTAVGVDLVSVGVATVRSDSGNGGVTVFALGPLGHRCLPLSLRGF
jgi:hypothetical protein